MFLKIIWISESTIQAERFAMEVMSLPRNNKQR